MYYRNILSKLDEWKIMPNRKPLVLRGARQVGKTTLVNIFAQKFETYIALNLEKPEEKGLFESNQPFQTILDAIFFTKKKSKTGTSTLIFIDEIQNSPKAVALLRYFYEEAPQIHVIAAESLLETLIDRQISFPVGRVDYLAVRPCSFDEFLGAMGEQIAQQALKQWPIPEYAHNQLLSLFNRFTLIGGMPGVLANYIQNHDLVALSRHYSSLLAGYADDVEKYAPRQSAVQHIRHILRTGFVQGCQRIKFERFGASDYRSREMGEAFRILEKAMLVELVYPTTSASLPFIPDYKKSPRLHWLDTGLLNFAAGIQSEVFGATEIQSAWRGKVAEHIVGQELTAENYDVLYRHNFWVREAKNSNAEIDYLFQYKNLLIPVEVKSDAGTTLKSLHSYLDSAPHHWGVRIWSKPFSIDQLQTSTGKRIALLNIPFYLTGRLHEVLSHFL